jgi:hypothetical protein
LIKKKRNANYASNGRNTWRKKISFLW